MPQPGLLSTFVSGLAFYGVSGLSVSGGSNGPATAKVVPRRVERVLQVTVAQPTVNYYLLLKGL